MTTAQIEVLRTAAAVAALVLVLLSRGDVVVLAALLVVACWRPWALAVVPAVVASAWRWGSTSLDALAGAQAVLGPAGFVGPTTAALASWLAALSVLLAATPQVGGTRVLNRDTHAPNVGGRLLRAAVAATGAAIVAGPAAVGGMWIRVVAIAIAWFCATGVAQVRTRSPLTARVVDALAVATGVAALAVATRAAPAWDGTVDLSAAREGVAISLAIVALGGMATTLRRATLERPT
ncbi:MAG: hypothetical protein WD691_10030 [Acidimicrobiales bacterium]